MNHYNKGRNKGTFNDQARQYYSDKGTSYESKWKRPKKKDSSVNNQGGFLGFLNSGNRNRNRSTSRKYDSNVQWGSGLTNPVLIVVVLICIYFIYPIGRAFKKLISRWTDGASESEKEAANQQSEAITEIDDTIDWTNLPKSETWYKSTAASIFTILSRRGIAKSSYGELYAKLTGLEGQELRAIFVKFGVKDYKTLIQWIKEDLAAWSVLGNPTIETSNMQVLWASSGISW